MCFEDSNRLSRLYEKRLVILEGFEACDNRLVAWPVAGCLAGAAVNDQFPGLLCNLGIKIVHHHAKRCFLNPSLAA